MNSVREGMGIPQDAYREIKILKEISRFPHEVTRASTAVGLC